MELPKSKAVVSDLRFVQSVDSTNQQLVREHQALIDFSVLVAASQTAGQGRSGRSWVSEPGASISLSVLLRPNFPQRSSLITFLMAASAHQALAKLIASDQLSIKWPNDLLVGERKLAGILAGANPDGSVVVGIGVNLSTQSTPETAIALDELAKADFDSVLASTLSCLKQNWQRFQSDEPLEWLLQYIRDNCSTLGRTVRAELVTGRVVVGKAIDIQDDGQLVIWADKEHVLAAADVWHLRK